MKRFVALMGLAIGLAAIISLALVADAQVTATVTFVITDEDGRAVPSTVTFDRSTFDAPDGRVRIPTTTGDHDWRVTPDDGMDERSGSVRVEGDRTVDVEVEGRETTDTTTDDGATDGGDTDDNAISLEGDECCCTVAVLLAILVLIVILRRMGII